ncbi:putative 2-keto-3-deoxy-galactonate aldolase YagE [Planctomycetes bacterium Pan216]|uniref:Putative 2-keto-3-deoxy-galactonate aldolase YagE n=1 Tax=Kolteria novifilia TaxID=2527975 RepID=A0A518B743_9BACT|nr:putative 2-keto-3-deoxy-galactonate aldolase YagE [Planctomycetes bacterium Pan216]
MESKAKIAGIYVPLAIPLLDDGSVNEPELRRYVNWLIEQGIDGLFLNGSTGEYIRFTGEERRQVARLITSEVDGKVQVIAGLGDENAQNCVESCKFYADLGVRAAALIAPTYFIHRQETIFAYLAEVAKSSPVDVTVYNIPFFANRIGVETVKKLVEEFPNVVGIKDSSGDIAHMQRMMDAVLPIRPDFAFITGMETTLFPMIVAGCNGGIHATAGVVPKLVKTVYEKANAGDFDAARKAQYRILRIFDPMMNSLDFPEGFRRGIALRGFDMRRGRIPAGVDEAEKAGKLEAVLNREFKELEELGLLG